MTESIDRVVTKIVIRTIENYQDNCDTNFDFIMKNNKANRGFAKLVNDWAIENDIYDEEDAEGGIVDNKIVLNESDVLAFIVDYLENRLKPTDTLVEGKQQ